jgi:5-methylcytosine-specific restriction endonuclease McrA
MSTNRKAVYRFTGPNQCHWCGKPPPEGRKTWCSKECVDQYTLRAWPQTLRKAVKARDKGVCALCGRDCEALKQRLIAWLGPNHQSYKDEHWGIMRHEPLEGAALQRRKHRLGVLRRFKLLKTDRFGVETLRSVWEADHTLPVIEGGGEADLSGVRSLCIPCHKRVTRELAKRRAAFRRAAKTALVPPQTV